MAVSSRRWRRRAWLALLFVGMVVLLDRLPAEATVSGQPIRCGSVLFLESPPRDAITRGIDLVVAERACERRANRSLLIVVGVWSVGSVVLVVVTRGVGAHGGNAEPPRTDAGMIREGGG